MINILVLATPSNCLKQVRHSVQTYELRYSFSHTDVVMVLETAHIRQGIAINDFKVPCWQKTSVLIFIVSICSKCIQIVVCALNLPTVPTLWAFQLGLLLVSHLQEPRVHVRPPIRVAKHALTVVSASYQFVECTLAVCCLITICWCWSHL